MKKNTHHILSGQAGAGIIEVLVAAIILSLLMVGLAQLITTGEEGEEGLRQKQLAGLRIQKEFDELTHQIRNGAFDITTWGTNCSSSTTCASCDVCKEKGEATTVTIDFNGDATVDGNIFIQVEQNPDLTIPKAGGGTETTSQFGYMVRCYIKDVNGMLISGMVTFVAMPN